MPIFKTRNANLHYIFLNNNKNETVLLGHSFLWDHEMWNPQIESLSKLYNLVIPDLWGHGSSDSIDLSHSNLNDLAEDNANLMDHLGIKKYHVVGLSVGGMWGARLALLYPDSVKSLVLMDTDLHNEEPVKQAKYYNLLNRIAMAGRITNDLADEITYYFHAPNADGSTISYIKSRILTLKDENIECIVQLGKIIFGRETILNFIDSLAMPVMIAVGEYDIPRPPLESERMHKFIKGSSLHFIPNAGHVSNIENPEFVNNVLEQFLLGVSEDIHEEL